MALALAGLAAGRPLGLPGQTAAPPAKGPTVEDCKGCHNTGPRTGRREPGVPPGFNQAALKASPHASLDCTACHDQVKEVPHADKLAPVDCGGCHVDEKAQYSASLHGKAAAHNDPYAPGCKGCHGTHNVVARSSPKSPIGTIAIPELCGRCHRPAKAGHPVIAT